MCRQICIALKWQSYNQFSKRKYFLLICFFIILIWFDLILLFNVFNWFWFPLFTSFWDLWSLSLFFSSLLYFFICFLTVFLRKAYINLACFNIWLWWEGNIFSPVRYSYLPILLIIMLIFLVLLYWYRIVVFHLLSFHRFSCNFLHTFCKIVSKP